MRRPSRLLSPSLAPLGLVAVLLLAGCTSPAEGPAPLPVPPVQVETPGSAVVHRDGGMVLPADAFPGELPAFEQLHVTSRISGEPTIALSRTGAVFYPAIDFDSGVPGVQKLPTTVVYRTVDAGATWEDYSPHLAGVKTHPYSFDPYIYGDPTTGRIFAVDMGPDVACNKVSWSDDDGRTWLTRDGACPTPVADHPNLFAAPKNPASAVLAPNNPVSPYPHTVFLCSNQVADVQCSQSPDGGFTWLPSQPVFTGVEPGLAEGTEPDLCGSLAGHGTASFTDGTIYIGKAHCGHLMAGVSRDGGLTWETVTIVDGDEYRPRGEHDVSIAADLAGNAYAFWIGNDGRTAWLARSTDQGATWTRPLNVTAPGVTAAKLPSMVAGAEGRIAFQYVGTRTPSGWAVEEEGHEAELRNATWDAYVGVSLDANATDPTFATVTVNDPARPLKRGGCDDRCFGDIGGMYDFLDIDFDPMTGRLWTSLVDVCTGECDAPGATADTFQRAMGSVGHQIGGTFLLAEPYPHATAEGLLGR